ncbi:hypothetical protein BDV98DRAFT_605683 [Pterulicium gracile]|uniref:Uncharacterized protein n=1 Tax=Pterulicium gracile TaxID=1884261 RepID=A0A5C3QE85_9AGAR|nr:hypothetical protein BDV98DRAFT_605683 [Pterula gracilis]
MSAIADDRAALASEYMRIAAITIFGFEYIQTLTSEFRIYRAQRSWKLTTGCQLFILVRYLGLAALITATYGFFSEGWSSDACAHYQHVAPLFKVFSAIANQAVFFWRTYAISGRKRWVLYTLIGVGLLTIGLQLFANSVTNPLVTPSVNPLPSASSDQLLIMSFWNQGGCIAAARPGLRVAFVFYLAAIMYDFLVLGLSWYHLAGTAGVTYASMFAFAQRLLGEGIIYVLIATLMNAINLVFFNLQDANTSIQGMFASLGIAVTAIASQRIILNLLDPKTGHFSSNNQHGSSYEFNNPNRGVSLRPTNMNRTMSSGRELGATSQMDVQIHVAVDVERDGDGMSVKKGSGPFR